MKRKMAEAVPPDLMTSWDVRDELGIEYERLKGWWRFGVIHSWKHGRFRLVSRAEVVRELNRRGKMSRESVEVIERQPEMGEVARLPIPRKLPAVALPNPEDSRAPEWTPGGPWGYTSR